MKPVGAAPVFIKSEIMNFIIMRKYIILVYIIDDQLES